MTAAPTPTETADRALREALVEALWNHRFASLPDASFAEAKAVARDIPDGKAANCVRLVYAEIDVLLAGPIAALRAENERLKGERDDALEKAHHWQKQFETLDRDCASLAANQCEGPMIGDERGHFSCAKIDTLASELWRTYGELMTARVALSKTADEMESATVFVTSRERIKHPEGTDLWRDAIAKARAAAEPEADAS